MRYLKNVQALCKMQGISNPIKEEDLTVKSLRFLIDGTWWLIPGSDMNLAGRLFFQEYVPKDRTTMSLRNSLGDEPTLFYFMAEEHFAEYWDDAEEVGRSMISALKRATEVEIHWKE